MLLLNFKYTVFYQSVKEITFNPKKITYAWSPKVYSP